jgi:hypothetical protein
MCRQRLATRGTAAQPDPPPRGGLAAAPSHPLAPLRDRQRSWGLVLLGVRRGCSIRRRSAPGRVPHPISSGSSRSRARAAAASSSTAAEAGTAPGASQQTLQLLLAGANYRRARRARESSLRERAGRRIAPSGSRPRGNRLRTTGERGANGASVRRVALRIDLSSAGS